MDPAAHGAKQEDRFYNNKSFQKPDVDPSDPSQQDAALKIQTKYRQHHAKKVNSRNWLQFRTQRLHVFVEYIEV